MPVSNNYHVYQIIFYKKFEIGLVFTLQISEKICDCVGNKIADTREIQFGLPEKIEKNNLVINEVLFNASSNGAEFIEIFNRSNKYFNAKQLYLGITKDNQNIKWFRLTEKAFLIQPSNYIVLSKSSENVISKYPSQNISKYYSIPDFVTLDDKSSIVILANDTFGIIDEMEYNEKMQMFDLQNKDDVSLERVNPNQPSNFPGNWHSASAFSGYATPGQKNSQFLSDTTTISKISITNEIFSPDNDGKDDILKIDYHCNQPGYRAQAAIYDLSGTQIRTLFTNTSLNIDGFFTWDGTNNYGNMSKPNPYIVFIQLITNTGKVYDFRKPCVLVIAK